LYEVFSLQLAHALQIPDRGNDITGRSAGQTGGIMKETTIQDWTTSEVRLTAADLREVEYRVYRSGDRHYQEIRDTNGRAIHTLELPEGMKLEASSYEVLLRYVLLDVVAA
jgi:hypothetical protein